MKAQNIRVRRLPYGIGTGYYIAPADAQADDALLRIPLGKPFTIRLWRERSHEQNSLYWQALEKVVEATGRWHTANELHLALKVACGYVDKVMLLDGRLVLVPGSIAFDRMNQEEAQKFYDAALRIVCNEIMEMPLEDLLVA